MGGSFDYAVAFSRNLGWISPDEQRILSQKRVAIAGLGGVGGLHLLTLARLGVGRFSLADPDRFELANFNRQVGATMSALGRSKLDVMTEMVRDVNPSLDLRIFADGVHAGNVDDFLSGVDVFVDGLDFFAFSVRETVFAACAAKNIPATTVAPLGMGAALLNFMPGSMSFADYFGLDDCPAGEKPLRFLLGLAPAMLHRRYLIDMSYVDLDAGRGPSTAMACQICAGIAATEAAKMMLKRGRVIAAPRGVQYDPYRQRMVHTWRPGGYRNPLQRLARRIARGQLARKRASPRAQ
jgi:molybdopterin/thiamine biosynthesis adenylyltransferase